MPDDSLVLILVPELSKTARERYEILRQIANMGPVGKHLLAVSTHLSENSIRKHLSVLSEQGLLKEVTRGIILSRKGESLLKAFTELLYKDPSLSDLEEQLHGILSMEKVVIVSGDSDDDISVKRKVAQEMADALGKILRDGNIVAVGGGETLSFMAEALPGLSMNVTVVPARGGFGENIEYQANVIAARAAEKMHGTYRMIHVPDGISPDLVRRIRSESPETAEAESLIHRADILAMGIGTARDMASVHMLPMEVKERLHGEGAVGEALGLYADITGKVIYRTYNIGISPDDLNMIPNVIIGASGRSKASAILAMANAGVRGTLITDEGAAKEILLLAHGETLKK